MSEPKTAFVTGASGFVGGALVGALLADGWTVRALARSSEAAAQVAAAGAEPVGGDLADRAAIRRGAEGAQVAFHAAAMAGEWGARTEFEATNVEGTANTLTACAAAGVGRFIHVGTEAALLRGRPLVNIDEEAPLQPGSKAPYSATKARAEELVRAANRRHFETIVVRPRLVWGRGDTTVLPALVEAVESGRFAWIGPGDHLTSTTHIDNAVRGLLLAADRGRPGSVYFITDGEPVEFRAFVSDLLTTKGVRVPTKSLPRPLARITAALGEAAWRRLPLSGSPPLTRLALWLSSLETTIDISRARSELGYEPVISRAEGLAELREIQSRSELPSHWSAWGERERTPPSAAEPIAPSESAVEAALEAAVSFEATDPEADSATEADATAAETAAGPVAQALEPATEIVPAAVDEPKSKPSTEERRAIADRRQRAEQRAAERRHRTEQRHSGERRDAENPEAAPSERRRGVEPRRSDDQRRAEEQRRHDEERRAEAERRARAAAARPALFDHTEDEPQAADPGTSPVLPPPPPEPTQSPPRPLPPAPAPPRPRSDEPMFELTDPDEESE